MYESVTTLSELSQQDTVILLSGMVHSTIIQHDFLTLQLVRQLSIVIVSVTGILDLVRRLSGLILTEVIMSLF